MFQGLQGVCVSVMTLVSWATLLAGALQSYILPSTPNLAYAGYFSIYSSWKRRGEGEEKAEKPEFA